MNAGQIGSAGMRVRDKHALSGLPEDAAEIDAK